MQVNLFQFRQNRNKKVAEMVKIIKKRFDPAFFIP